MRGACHKDVPYPVHKRRRREKRWAYTATGLHAGSDPGGAGCLRLSGLQTRPQGFLGNPWSLTGWLARKGGAKGQDINNDERRSGLSHCPRRVRFPALDVTMAPKQPQPRVEGVNLSGAMARQGGSLHHGPGDARRRTPAYPLRHRGAVGRLASVLATR
jgi:hypothetical protein